MQFILSFPLPSFHRLYAQKEKDQLARNQRQEHKELNFKRDQNYKMFKKIDYGHMTHAMKDSIEKLTEEIDTHKR